MAIRSVSKAILNLRTEAQLPRTVYGIYLGVLTGLVPRGLRGDDLRTRLVTRIKEDYSVGYTDIDPDDGTVGSANGSPAWGRRSRRASSRLRPTPARAAASTARRSVRSRPPPWPSDRLRAASRPSRAGAGRSRRTRPSIWSPAPSGSGRSPRWPPRRARTPPTKRPRDAAPDSRDRGQPKHYSRQP